MENITEIVETSLIKPIEGRHIPYRLNNGEFIIQNDIILVIDQLDSSVCACQTTEENLTSLGIISTLETSASESVAGNLTSDSTVTDSSTNNSGTKVERWSKDATLFLIDQWQKNKSKFASTTVRNEEVWKNIVKELESAGFPKYTWKQAEDKWKNIRKGYMKVKDNRGDKSSGAARVTCKFYDELDEIFRKSPSVKPISIASSRNCNSFPVTNESDSDESLKHQPIRKKTKLERDTFAWLSTFREDAREEKREAAREKRHQETLHILSKAIESYEVQMQKLIDKF